MRMLLLALLPALSGCAELFGDRDAHQPGTPLGTFQVVGIQTTNTCGEGALGAQRSWSFDVDLARDEGALFWDSGATILEGEVEDDGVSFSIDARVVVDLRGEGMPKGLPCAVERRDEARGELGAAGIDVDAFTATLSYSFAPTLGSRCNDLVADAPSEVPGAVDDRGPASSYVFATLPCGMVYDLEAKRSAVPPR